DRHAARPARRAAIGDGPLAARRALALLEDHERDLAIGPPAVVLVAAVDLHDLRPQALALLGTGDAGMYLPAAGADLDRRVGVRHQVVKPGGVLRIAALRGDQDHVLAVARVDERARAPGSALGADVVDEQHRW